MQENDVFMEQRMLLLHVYCILLFLCVKQSQNLNKFRIIWKLQMIMQTFRGKNV